MSVNKDTRARERRAASRIVAAPTGHGLIRGGLMMLFCSCSWSAFRVRAGARAGVLVLSLAGVLSAPGVASASVSSLTQGKGISLSPNPITSTGTISLALPLSLSFTSASQIFSLTNTSTTANTGALRARGHTFGISATGGAGGEGVMGSGGASGYGVYGQGGGSSAGVVGKGGASDGAGVLAKGTASGVTDHTSGDGVIATAAAADPAKNLFANGAIGVLAYGGNDNQAPNASGFVGHAGPAIVAFGGIATNGNYGGAGIAARGGPGINGGGDGIDAAGSGAGSFAGKFSGDVNVTGTLTTAKLVAPLAFQTLSLVNGWTAYGHGTGTPAVAVDGQGIVHFRGAMSHTGTFERDAFVLPAPFRPSHIEYVPVDMFSASTGRIQINTDGTVEVQDTNGGADAQGFTSLDGVTYTLG